MKCVLSVVRSIPELSLIPAEISLPNCRAFRVSHRSRPSSGAKPAFVLWKTDSYLDFETSIRTTSLQTLTACYLPVLVTSFSSDEYTASSLLANAIWGVLPTASSQVSHRTPYFRTSLGHTPAPSVSRRLPVICDDEADSRPTGGEAHASHKIPRQASTAQCARPTTFSSPNIVANH